MPQPTHQPELSADWLTNEIRAVARETRRQAIEGATEDERLVLATRKRALLAELNQRSVTL